MGRVTVELAIYSVHYIVFGRLNIDSRSKHSVGDYKTLQK